MHIGPLGFMSRTSSRTVFNIASWHSSHSLTWRWTLSLRRHGLSWRPHATINSIGLGVGIGQLVAGHAYRDNNGWQASVSLLWHSLDFHQQRPMWFRDLWRKRVDEVEALHHENAKLHHRIAAVEHNAARAASVVPTGPHIN